jgi:hypothetical protein
MHAMKRRTWIQIGCLALAACGKQRQRGQTVNAGPFSVQVPTIWMESPRVQKMPMNPVYTPEAWAALQQDPLYTLKPGYSCRPSHWAIQLPRLGLPEATFNFETAADDPTAPQILIHETQGWETVYANGVHSSEAPGLTPSGLRSDLEKAWQEADHFPESPAFFDGSLNFLCLKKTIPFKGGKGVRMLGQILQEPDLMCRGRLHYLFLGMSDDSSCQIIATFPVDLKGLPSGDYSDDKAHLGWSLDDYATLSREMATYAKVAVAWLETREDLIVPRLKSLDAMLESLVVRSWT